MGEVLTSGVLSAGLDVTRLSYLLRYDIPESVTSTFQEIGCVGRRKEATHLTNLVDIAVPSDSYQFLLRQDQYQLLRSKLSPINTRKIVNR